MCKTILRSLLFALTGVLTLNLHAELTWTTGSCAPSAWTALADNLLAGQTGTIDGTIATGYSTKDPDLLTDGAVPTAGGKDWIVGFQSGASIAWKFQTPTTLEQIRVSAGYLATPSFSGITVSKVEFKSYGAADEWQVFDVAAGQVTATAQADILSLVLSDENGAPMATNIGELKVTFGAPPSGFANYCAEIEAVGYSEVPEPVGTWTKDTYAWEDWRPLANNILANNVPSGSGTSTWYWNTSKDCLSDGQLSENPTDGNYVIGLRSGTILTWSFDNAMTLEKIRITSQDNPNAYGHQSDGVSIDVIEVRYSDSEEWVSLYQPVKWMGPGLDTARSYGATTNLIATLADENGAYLARGVVGLRMTFGKEKYYAASGNFTAEIEAVGHPSSEDAVPPEFGEPTVSNLSAKKATVSVALADLGGKATTASIDFAYGLDPAKLRASERLTDSAIAGADYGKELTGLTPETTYYYAFYATNDVVEAGAICTGSFTTPSVIYYGCTLDLSAGNLSVRVGNTTYTESTTVPMAQGEVTTFRVIPDADYEFLCWDGDVEPGKVMTNPLAIVAKGACTIKPIGRQAGASQVFTWNGGNGDWTDPAMWNRSAVPTAADSVVIDSGVCTGVVRAIVSSLTLSENAKLHIAERNAGDYGNLTVVGNLTLSGTAELDVSAGPIDGDKYTLATGCGFVTVGGTFEIKDTAKFAPCCDQYSGGGVVTTAGRFVLESTASVEAISLGYARFEDNDPPTLAPGAGTDGTHGASYGGYGQAGYVPALNTGVAPYGFANAPIHPGSPKYPHAGVNYNKAGGGNVRIHAGSAVLAGKVDVTAAIAGSMGAPSGGGIWITAAKTLKVKPTTRLLANGQATQNPGFGCGNSGGGRIAFGLRLKDEEIAALASTGELPINTQATVCGEEEFLAAYPDVTINVEGGYDGKTQLEPLPACNGTFRFLKGPDWGFLLLVR